MPYELRVAGKPNVTFETEPEAVAAAKRLIADDPDADPEIVDSTTGAPVAPGSDKRSREELRKKIGF